MGTIDIDGEEAASGLVALVVAVVELLVDAMEREAIRRMESGTLTDEEVDRLGQQLAALRAEIDRLKEQEGVEDGVASFREDLDGVVSNAVRSLEEPTRRGGQR